MLRVRYLPEKELPFESETMPYEASREPEKYRDRPNARQRSVGA